MLKETTKRATNPIIPSILITQSDKETIIIFTTITAKVTINIYILIICTFSRLHFLSNADLLNCPTLLFYHNHTHNSFKLSLIFLCLIVSNHHLPCHSLCPVLQEWFEFKENWFQPEALGEYVAALSNAAASHYKKYVYFIWGVEDENHKIVGTTFNQYCDYNKEPYQNYLARNLSPSLGLHTKWQSLANSPVPDSAYIFVTFYHSNNNTTKE